MNIASLRQCKIGETHCQPGTPQLRELQEKRQNELGTIGFEPMHLP